MTCAPEVVVGAIACIICSISGLAYLVMNKKKEEPPFMYMGEPGLEFDDIGPSPYEQMERLDTYIQRQRRMEAERILNGRLGGALQPVAPPVSAAVVARNVPQAGMGRTTVVMPQMQGGGFGHLTPHVNMPYLYGHQLQNYPYAGAQVL
jgi:hypothetical protein